MDAANVGMQVLSPAAGWAPYSTDQTVGVEAARIGNDLTAELAARGGVVSSHRQWRPVGVYYDTVGHGSHAALLCAWNAFGADHLVPGSDFPVLLSYETYARTFEWIREVGLPAADVESILERNAPRVLGATSN